MASRRRGLNENLGREIMELHTLGVRSGYTQADVTEFARALTGWGAPLTGRLAIVDMLERRWREVGVPEDPECPICIA